MGLGYYGSERTDLSVSKRGVARFVTISIIAVATCDPRSNYCISLGIAFTSIDFLIQCASDLVWTLE
jgi:hypothetical protein